MTFTVSKSELLARLQSAGKIMSAKAALPIMSTFLFEIKEGRLFIAAADSAGQIHTSMDCKTDIEELRICIEHKMLIESLKTLPEQPVQFDINELNIRINYKGGKFDFMGMDPATFPALKKEGDTERTIFPCGKFLKGIAAVNFCALDDGDLRPIMNTILVEGKSSGQINFAGTDGHKMGVLELHNENIHDFSFALPKKVASILKSILPNNEDESLSFSIGNNDVSFSFENYQVYAQLFEGKYPNYQSVIPTGNDKKVIVKATYLKDALSRVGVFTNSSSKLVKIELLNNSLKVTGNDIDFSTNAEELVPCDYTGEELLIGFNSSFMGDILSALQSEECEISFSTANKAMLIYPIPKNEDELRTYLLMPLTIRD